jgi:hypothetical protein
MTNPDGYMKTPYQYLVEKRGLEGAKEEMKRRRSLVKRPGRKPQSPPSVKRSVTHD